MARRLSEMEPARETDRVGRAAAGLGRGGNPPFRKSLESRLAGWQRHADRDRYPLAIGNAQTLPVRGDRRGVQPGQDPRLAEPSGSSNRGLDAGFGSPRDQPPGSTD